MAADGGQVERRGSQTDRRGSEGDRRDSGPQTLSIIVPAYNEEDNIARLLRAHQQGDGRGGPALGADLQRRPLARTARRS